MCDFFSFVTDVKGKKYYFNKEQRELIDNDSGEMKGKNYEKDSHSSIASYYNLNDDKVNKYEYVIRNSGMKFVVDQVNIKDDSRFAKKWVLDNDDIIISCLDSCYAYLYCRYIKDSKEVSDRITDSHDAYQYCREVKDRKEVRDRITNSCYAYLYCRDVKDRKEVRDRITDSDYAYLYCCEVNKTDVRLVMLAREYKEVV